MSWSEGRRRGSLRKVRVQSHADPAAVSDVVGSILLVGMTVGMTVVLALLLMTYQGPQAATQAHLAFAVSPGAGGWGTGDEKVIVRHLGGDSLSASTHVLLSVGTTQSDVTGAALGGGFSDGRLVIGETWTRTTTIKATDLVVVNLVGADTGTSQLIAASTMLPGGSP